MKNKVIPTIIAQLKERFNKGEEDEIKGGDTAIQNQEGDDSDDDEIDDANKIENQEMNWDSWPIFSFSSQLYCIYYVFNLHYDLLFGLAYFLY